MTLKPIILILTTTLAFFGCTAKESHSHPHSADQKHSNKAHTHADILLCGKCGHIKGGEKCCDKDAVMCGCGTVKGAPACCKIQLTGIDIQLCDHCGHVEGDDLCCNNDAEQCSKCNKAKGSPGCCLKHEHKHS